MVWCPLSSHTEEKHPMTDPNLILPETRTNFDMLTSKVLWLILEICLKSPLFGANSKPSRGLRCWFLWLRLCPVALHFSLRLYVAPRVLCDAVICTIQIRSQCDGDGSLALVLLLHREQTNESVSFLNPSLTPCFSSLPNHTITITGKVQQEADRQVRP